MYLAGIVQGASPNVGEGRIRPAGRSLGTPALESHLSRGHFLPDPGFEPTNLGYLGFQVQHSIH